MIKHGQTKTRFYNIWKGIRVRCNNKNRERYAQYGGRGILVCEHWSKFENFYSDMKKSYDAHVKKFGEFDTTIERKNNDGNYDKNNCKWATRKEQAINKSGNFERVISDSEIKKIKILLSAGESQYKIAKKFNISQSCVSMINTGKQRFKPQ